MRLHSPLSYPPQGKHICELFFSMVSEPGSCWPLSTGAFQVYGKRMSKTALALKSVHSSLVLFYKDLLSPLRAGPVLCVRWATGRN